MGAAIAALVWCGAGFGATADAAPSSVPALQTRVTDLAHLLRPGTVQQLESQLAAHETQTKQQFALLIVPSLGDEPIEDYGVRVFESWKLGAKKVSNGCLVVVAVAERKVRIEVGYGLEGVLTDLFTGRVIRQIIVPGFRNQAYDQALLQAMNVLMAQAQGEAGDAANQGEQDAPPRGGRLHAALLLLLLVVFGFPALWALMGFGQGPRGGPGGGGFGGFGGGFGGGGFGGGGFSGGGGGSGGGGASGSW